MKQLLIILVAGLLIAACGDGREETPQSGEPVEAGGEITPVARTIAGSFDAAVERISLGDASGGVGLLLDIPLMTGPEQSLPAGFKQHIEQARTAFAANDRAAFAAALRAALLAWIPDWSEDRKPLPGGKNHEPAPLARVFLDRIHSARELMKKGEAEPAVTVLLEALLLIQPASEN